MRDPRILILAFAVLSFCAIDVAAQAWIQPLDGYYVKLTASYLSTDQQYNFHGDLEPMAAEDPLFSRESYNDISFTGYVEYGMSDRYTLVAMLPFKISTTENTQVPLLPGDSPSEASLSNGGLSDLWVWLRAPITQGPTAASVQAGVKIPLGYEEFPDNGGPALGTSEIDAEAVLSLGQSLYPFPAYVSVGFGYRFRGGTDFDDEIIYNIEAGYSTGPLFLKVRFDGLQNVGDIVDPSGGMQIPDAIGASSVDANARNQDRYQITPVIAYNFSESFGISAEAYHVLGGKNTIAGTTWAVGVVLTPAPRAE